MGYNRTKYGQMMHLVMYIQAISEFLVVGVVVAVVILRAGRFPYRALWLSDVVEQQRQGRRGNILEEVLGGHSHNHYLILLSIPVPRGFPESFWELQYCVL